MRNTLYFTALCLALAFGSCDAQKTYVGSNDFVTKELNLAGFTGVLVSDGTEATITHGAEFSVVIRVNDNLLDRVRAEVNDGVLFVAFESGSYRREELSLTVTMPTVATLRAVDGGVIDAGPFQGLDQLQLEAYDAGRIAFSGTAAALQLRAADAGKVRAFELSAAVCEAKVSDGARVELRVTDALTGQVSDGGRIAYRGTPTVEVRTSDGGRVIQAN
jgi:hypothetical protein